MAVAAAVAGAPIAEAGDETRQFTYVASATGAFTTLDKGQPDGLAVAGQMRFTPRRTSFTLRVDDRTIPDGQTVAMAVYGSREGFIRCVPVRTTVKIGGVIRGKEAMVSVLGDGAWLPDPSPGCTGHASGGMAEVRL